MLVCSHCHSGEMPGSYSSRFRKPRALVFTATAQQRKLIALGAFSLVRCSTLNLRQTVRQNKLDVAQWPRGMRGFAVGTTFDRRAIGALESLCINIYKRDVERNFPLLVRLEATIELQDCCSVDIPGTDIPFSTPAMIRGQYAACATSGT